MEKERDTTKEDDKGSAENKIGVEKDGRGVW